jgi:hypothetical protein
VCINVACFIGLFSKLRSLNLLSAPFDEQQFFVGEDEFEQTNLNTGDIDNASIRFRILFRSSLSMLLTINKFTSVHSVNICSCFSFCSLSCLDPTESDDDNISIDDAYVSLCTYQSCENSTQQSNHCLERISMRLIKKHETIISILPMLTHQLIYSVNKSLNMLLFFFFLLYLILFCLVRQSFYGEIILDDIVR